MLPTPTTRKPAEMMPKQLSEQGSFQGACKDMSSRASGQVRSAFYQQPADMRDDSDLSVAGADFLSGAIYATGDCASHCTYAARLRLAIAWFQQASATRSHEDCLRVARGACAYDVGELGCIDLMEHALAIARVLKIEMPGFIAALLRPSLADTARKFAQTVADGLDEYVRQVEGDLPAREDAHRADYFAATSALRSDRPNLSGIWSRNSLFAMNHLDDKSMLLAKVEQYTAKQQTFAHEA